MSARRSPAPAALRRAMKARGAARAALLCLLLLAGCGQMGPLYRPPPAAADGADPAGD